jgi:hypothetical protein
MIWERSRPLGGSASNISECASGWLSMQMQRKERNGDGCWLLVLGGWALQEKAAAPPYRGMKCGPESERRRRSRWRCPLPSTTIRRVVWQPDRKTNSRPGRYNVKCRSMLHACSDACCVVLGIGDVNFGASRFSIIYAVVALASRAWYAWYSTPYTLRIRRQRMIKLLLQHHQQQVNADFLRRAKHVFH